VRSNVSVFVHEGRRRPYRESRFLRGERRARPTWPVSAGAVTVAAAALRLFQVQRGTGR